MIRKTGKYQITVVGDEKVRAFIPHPLPPARPALLIEGDLAVVHAEALAALGRLKVAGAMVPSANWFLYGFVRKEAVISSQIEGTQATLMDVLEYESSGKASNPADIEEVCNYVNALEYLRAEIAKPRGLPICTRLLQKAHKRLMRGIRGSNKQPGTIRKSQNWIGGTRPGNAAFVPPPHDALDEALGKLDKWIHAKSPLPPLVRAGLAHVQFETIHPFLDGNGRIGRLLITLLIEHWGLIDQPLLYLSLAFKRHRAEYYRTLASVRIDGDWEGWTEFFLRCVCEAADDGVNSASTLQAQLAGDRQRVTACKAATVTAIRLLDLLPNHPIITLAGAVELLDVSKPTVIKAIAALSKAGVLKETTGRQRDRVYAYEKYLQVLTEDTDVIR